VKFAHYRSLASCFDLSIDKLDGETLNQLKEKAEDYFKSNHSLECENQTFSMTDIFALIDSLRSPSTIVFQDWIRSDKVISIILQGNKEKLNFQETISNKKYRGHALEQQFYSFLTPFLYQLLEPEVTESIANRNFERLRFYLQYSSFLEESKKTALQQEVDSELRNLFSDISALEFGKKVSSPKKESDKWTKNSREVKLLASLDLVDILNLLDKQYYALRVSYIDTVKSIMTHPNIDPISFKMLSTAIKKVELNNSHKSQVDSFLQKGKTSLSQKQQNKVFNKALLRNPLIYLGFVGVIILILLIFPFDFTNNNPSIKEKISGLDSLSQDEVKITDSLLAFKEDSTLFETDDMNVPVALPDFILSDNTKEIKNTVALKLYESMLNDYEIQQNNGTMSCDPLEDEKLKEFNYKEVGDIEQDFVNHELINESTEDCYLLYFKNENFGTVYGEYVPAGNSIELKLVKDWRVIFYTGKEFTSFNPLKTSNNGYGNLEDAKKIDKSFTTHFCEMNYSNFRVLSKIYHVESIGKTTRLFTNSNGSLQIESTSIRSIK
jgi:hypothetical protein